MRGPGHVARRGITVSSLLTLNQQRLGRSKVGCLAACTSHSENFFFFLSPVPVWHLANPSNHNAASRTSRSLIAYSVCAWHASHPV